MLQFHANHPRIAVAVTAAELALTGRYRRLLLLAR